MKGKIIFEDLYSVFERPTVEKEFNSEGSLNCWLREFGGWKYAHRATVYINNEKLMTLHITDGGSWKYEKS